MKNKDFGKTVITVFGVIIVCVLLLKGYSLPIDDRYMSIDNYYSGMNSNGSTIDPKEYYYSLYNMSYSQELSGCRTVIIESESKTPIGINGNILCVEPPTSTELPTDSEGNIDYRQILNDNGKGLFKDGSDIIMPIGNYKFKNNNIVNSTIVKDSPTHSIELISEGGRGQYIIVFDDVMTWWCHRDEPSVNAVHNLNVGDIQDSKVRSVPQGYIIGVARETTTIHVYKVKQTLYEDKEQPVYAENIKAEESLMGGIHSALEEVPAGDFFYGV